MIEIILGLPHLRQGPILARTLKLGAPLLVSANALSRWRGQGGRRRWAERNTTDLARLPAGTDLTLDSGGFTSHMVYGGLGSLPKLRPNSWRLPMTQAGRRAFQKSWRRPACVIARSA